MAAATDGSLLKLPSVAVSVTVAVAVAETVAETSIAESVTVAVSEAVTVGGNSDRGGSNVGDASDSDGGKSLGNERSIRVRTGGHSR